MGGTGSDARRPYGGVSADERADRRRRRLLDAGLELFGTKGYAATSMKAVCAEAGLTERYFYEAFGGREDLLAAVYEEVIADALGAVRAAVAVAERTLEARTRAGLRAFMHSLADDRRRGRVQLFEVVGVSERLDQRRRQAMYEFAELVEASAREMMPPDDDPPVAPPVLCLGVVGATNELLIDWMLGRLEMPLDDLADQLTTLYLAAAATAAADDGAPEPDR